MRYPLFIIVIVIAFWSIKAYAAEQEGVLALKTIPDNASIYINDQLTLNSTPAVIRLSPGNYSVRVEKQWLGQQFEVTIESGSTVVKDFELTPIIGATLIDSLKDGKPCPYCPEMVFVPAGQLTFGNADGIKTEGTARLETITKPFAIGKYEVTFAEYDAFSNTTDALLPYDNEWGRGNLPVINVNWHRATAYARWLSEQTGHFYRLPTEVEWEYAARAGTQTEYWWGTEIGQGNANCAVCGSQWDKQSSAPVGSFQPNPFGLYDMLGNVQEWSCSQYDHFNQGKHRRCGVITSLKTRYAIRGGAWNSATIVHVTYRRGSKTTQQSNHLGFRLVRLYFPQQNP